MEKQIKNEIEKLKFHNLTLLKLIQSDESKKDKVGIEELIIKYDLSKKDIKELTQLISTYKDKLDFEEKARNINDSFNGANLKFILEGFLNSDFNSENLKKILQTL